MAQINAQKLVVVITGASAGIGAPIAARFAPGGYRIVAVARRKEPVDLSVKAFGRLDCLIKHATDDATLDEVIKTSQKAPFRFCRAALRVMKPGASIINIGSTFGTKYMVHRALNAERIDAQPAT